MYSIVTAYYKYYYNTLNIFLKINLLCMCTVPPRLMSCIELNSFCTDVNIIVQDCDYTVIFIMAKRICLKTIMIQKPCDVERGRYSIQALCLACCKCRPYICMRCVYVGVFVCWGEGEMRKQFGLELQTYHLGIQLSGRAIGCSPIGPWFKSECPLQF